MSELIGLITEILDNAERHSHPETRDGSWSLSASMVRVPIGDRIRFDCHFAFLSLGASFAESLNHAGPGSRRLVDEYLTMHSAKPGQSHDTLATVVCLQDWVTADAGTESDRRGGLGLMHVLRFINTLGGGCSQGDEPQMVIISGNSLVKCCVPYLVPEEEETTLRRTMWFNPNNEPTVAPDPQFVHDLANRFPGTLISVKFSMDGAHLRKLADDGDNDR